MEIIKVNLKEKFDSFTDFWSPKIVGGLNGQLVKLAKFKGEFTSHCHDDEDEMFLVIDGSLIMEMENESIEINAGEFIIIPRKTMHKPIAKEEVQVILFEPNTTLNTGDKENEFTVRNLDQL